MAEGDVHIFGEFIEQLMLANHDLDGHSAKCALYCNWVPDVDTDTAYTSTGEISTTGYTAAGDTLGVGTVTLSAATNTVDYDNTDANWASLATQTITEGMVYNVATSAAEDIIAYVEITTNANGGSYTISWNADGILEISYS